ncbi:MAG: galactose mutarotase [Clostridia bacterium]|nr:galactose mutarotase [Clostridia bacterium]
MKKMKFGSVNGKNVTQYTISNGKMTVEIINYGATVRSIKLNMSDGTIRDVVAGYNTVEEYKTQSGYLGATVGRVANRIGGANYTLNGKVFTLNKNDGENTLHGGLSGFNDKVWEILDYGEDFVSFKYLSVDGEEGFGGNLTVTVRYTVTKENSLKIEYSAICDADTPISLTNHSYFNLNGEGGKNIFDTYLQIDADRITLVDDHLIPSGKCLEVGGTAYDFRNERKIGDYFNSDDLYLKKFGCYDTNFMLNGNGYRKIATAKDGGVEMQVFSDAVGVQLYTETFLEGRKGKCCVYKKGSAFCLETQNVPNAVNCKEFPSCILKKGEEYSTTTEYVFKF